MLRLQVATALQHYDNAHRLGPFAVESETLMIYRAHGNALSAYARVFTADAEEADDVVQEAFLQYLLVRAQGTEVEFPRRWLLTRVHELLRDRERILAGKPVAEAETEAAKCEGMLLDYARRKLPKSQKEIFRLRLLGLAYDDIANCLGIQTRAVSRQLSLGIKRLKDWAKQGGLADV